jgi:hypothetical protein
MTGSLALAGRKAEAPGAFLRRRSEREGDVDLVGALDLEPFDP